MSDNTRKKIATLRISQNKLRRLYEMSKTGVYDEELLEDITSRMIEILKLMSTSGIAKIASIKCKELYNNLLAAKTDAEKMIAIDCTIHYAHTSGIYAQHLIKGAGKTDIIAFLSELAGIENTGNEKELVEYIKTNNVSTVPKHALYGTIEFPMFQELNKTAIRDTRKRFEAMQIKESTFRAHQTLLDIGCNIGHMLFEATAYGFPLSFGLEMMPHIVATGNKIINHLKMADRIQIKQANINALTEDKLKELTGYKKFDIVFCFAVDGYVSDPQKLYKLLGGITTNTLYFESNNHKITWTEEKLKALGFTTISEVEVPYDKEFGTTRKCFICRK